MVAYQGQAQGGAGECGQAGTGPEDPERGRPIAGDRRPLAGEGPGGVLVVYQGQAQWGGVGESGQADPGADPEGLLALAGEGGAMAGRGSYFLQR